MSKTNFGLIVLILLASTAAHGQPIGVGLKLGVPFNDGFKVFPLPTFTPVNAHGQQFVFGPYVELRLPSKFAIEADALHRSYNFENSVTTATGTSWEFPVVVKKRFGDHLIRPYVEGGGAFSHLSDIRFSTLAHRSNYGVVAGAGVELNLLIVKIAPEIRYTGWALHNFDNSDLQSVRNQLTVLVSFGF
jgi:hypothetical protein